MNIKRVLVFVFVVFLSVPLVSQAGRNCKKSKQVVILHTNDMHSKIDNMAKLTWLADSLRQQHRYLFLVSAGDNFTGNPIVDMYPRVGYPMVDLMNQAGFVLSAMGNHEFDMGQEQFSQRRKEADFPFISANIDVSKAHLKKIKPWVTLKAGKCRIPVVSFIQLDENGLPSSHPSRLEGITFTPAEVRAADFLFLKEKYGMLVGLTHLGIEGDVPLAQKYPQFDLIIGGHSHTIMDVPRVENGVTIVQTGSQLKSVGKTTLTIEGGKITNIGYELISLDALKGRDSAVQAAIDRYNDNEEMNRVLAEAITPMTGKEELGAMMTDALTAMSGVDIAFQNVGGIRIPSLPAGNIHYRDIFRLDPFGNQVVVFNMTPAEIKSLVLNAFNRNKEPDLMVSGMTYTALVNGDGVCVDVEMKGLDGQPLDPAKTYKVGMNSYISASYTFDHADPGTVNYETTAQTLISYLQKVKKVDYQGTRRTTVRSI
mgnify:FL=1